MKKFVLFLLIYAIPITAQEFNFDKEVSDKVIQSIGDISSSLISNSFSPFTHFNKNEYQFSGAGGFCNVNEIDNKDKIQITILNGGIFATGIGYAVSNKIILYGIFSSMYFEGKIKSNLYGTAYDKINTDVSYFLSTANTGIGYDLYRNSNISIPIFIGLHFQYCTYEFTPESIEWEYLSNPYSVKAIISGNNILSGTSGGIAFSFRFFEKYKITPYYLFLMNFNGAVSNVKTTIKQQSSPYFSIENNTEFETENVLIGMTGLSVSAEVFNKLELSASISGLISPEIFPYQGSEDGLDMFSIIVSFNYSFSPSTE